MEHIASDIITILQYLLPGFIAAWIFYALTSYPKQSQFERVIQALIFTMVIQGLVLVIQYCAENIYQLSWSKNINLVSSLIVSIMFGLVISYFANNDKFHKLLRYFKITKETSYASEWFGAFSDRITYVVLHLNDGRRIYGWPVEWPTEPNNGHFLLKDSNWLGDDNSEKPLTGVDGILIDGSNVEFVEFMELNQEISYG